MRTGENIASVASLVMIAGMCLFAYGYNYFRSDVGDIGILLVVLGAVVAWIAGQKGENR